MQGSLAHNSPRLTPLKAGATTRSLMSLVEEESGLATGRSNNHHANFVLASLTESV